MPFDFGAFKRAYETKDVAAWIGFFAEDAEWWEYHERNPPRSPKVIRGRANIWKLLEAVANAPVELKIDDEIVTSERAAFRAWVILPDGNRIVEHVMLDTEEGKIARQVEVEAWD